MLIFGVALAGPALAQPVVAQMVAPVQTVAPGADRATLAVPTTPPCTEDCRGSEAGSPAASDTITMTPDGKTTVPRTVIREQADFRLNEVLRNVPGITRR